MSIALVPGGRLDRVQEYLDLGLSHKQIARRLRVSTKTVQRDVREIESRTTPLDAEGVSVIRGVEAAAEAYLVCCETGVHRQDAMGNCPCVEIWEAAELALDDWMGRARAAGIFEEGISDAR